MPKHKTKPVKILAIVAAVALVGAGVWLATQNKKSENKSSSDAKVVSTQEATDANKLTKPTDTTNASGDATSASASTSTMTILVSRPVNGDTLPLAEGIQMRVAVSGSSSKTGTCNLTATGPSGQQVSKSADFTTQPSYSACSIDIPSNQLSAGSWSLSLTATSGGTTTKPLVTKVTLQ